MVGSAEDQGRSSRLGADDLGWSSMSLVLSGRTIEKSGDAVCGMHRAQGDEERRCLCLASKPRLTGFPIWTSKPASAVW
jgi:hypothetical protein